ncbi:spore coat protein [Candidatus Gottesmanbacteria bacterium RIFCSPLOWO2_01_FULL_40_10]|uniref:glucose-1-phosphate thymidylyltransferase n=1 Tax=Candidatus Gottesmanbacteria bacterium RIFCSPHIGHO2_01_FULL_40_15 TaxID=1798376 RepID=A0A1F5Z1R1_9BACT|nr:MAG: spore coat protein [Candidatus Gottesmanbacteria bacterium RIFCSPHIGHO2_01_FULL_40_15]OGG20870.1 MAG: spore coat protein [Candidatus Gottesmanbacteria bacterium RIFCSPLOWO2_01_FULL_40_10]OGG25789.1 MAG: spore coat protein [Candidatus Gottesmanbacteria bacterium RIFCSPHIGHO2_12_FULL_40_13]OGG32342.1 MAG: spore coat protein [Candidatus Gottesmanbacteria bacterium RIFCSPLOWO2_02_FULL_40_10]
MKGIILAGGLGTRLYPLTHATNKHLLPVYNRPMIFYPVKTLVSAGVTEILIVTSGPHAGHFLRVLKNGKELGVAHLEYAYQEKPDGGIADALLLAEDFADKGPITVILGDNTTDANIASIVKKFKSGAMIFLKKISERGLLKRFGVAVFDENNPQKIKKIEEKPKNPQSQYVATGLYIYDKFVFDHIRACRPSNRGEIEITDVNNLYLKKGALNWEELKGFWSDAGTVETLYKANAFWAGKGGI